MKLQSLYELVFFDNKVWNEVKCDDTDDQTGIARLVIARHTKRVSCGGNSSSFDDGGGCDSQLLEQHYLFLFGRKRCVMIAIRGSSHLDSGHYSLIIYLGSH